MPNSSDAQRLIRAAAEHLDRVTGERDDAQLMVRRLQEELASELGRIETLMEGIQGWKAECTKLEARLEEAERSVGVEAEAHEQLQAKYELALRLVREARESAEECALYGATRDAELKVVRQNTTDMLCAFHDGMTLVKEQRDEVREAAVAVVERWERGGDLGPSMGALHDTLADREET